jgi:hypothetical protein
MPEAPQINPSYMLVNELKFSGSGIGSIGVGCGSGVGDGVGTGCR